MIEQERLVPYLNSLEQPESALLSGIRREAVADGVPIIREETAALLRFFVRERRPARILEVGTAVGYSALVMAEQMPEACTITTMEKYEKRIPEAKKNFAAFTGSSSPRFDPVGQCAAGWRCGGVPICSDETESDDPQTDAGLFVHTETYRGTFFADSPGRRRCGIDDCAGCCPCSAGAGMCKSE